MADAPKILGTDSLRKAYPKLNSAIDNSNEALTKSNSADTRATDAVNTANAAETKADSVQTQFNQVVIEGDSSVEAAQARVDADGNAFTTLKDRLDDRDAQLAENTQQLNKPKTIEQVIEKMLNKQPVTIVAYGDSITWGYVPNSGSQTANPYPSYLQTLLRDYYGYSDITVVNKGNSGKQSDEFASDSYVNGVIAENPDMVIFMCGINDCRGGTSGGAMVPVKEYKDNIALMVSKLPYPFIFMTPTFFQDTEERKNRFTQYVQAMKEMAKKLSVKLVDLNAIVLKDLEVREVAFTDVALDNVHYTDDYYKRLAEFIFSFGLCNNDLSIKGERFINPLDSLFRWKNGINNYYTSSINPLKQNIYLKNDVADFMELTLFLFSESNELDLQTLYVPNSVSSPNNTVEVNGVSYSQPTNTPNQTIWKLRVRAIPLKYGLNKIVYRTSGATAGKVLQLIYGVNIIKREKKILGIEKKFSGSVQANTETTGTQKRTKIATFKDNNFSKINIKFTPSTNDSGIALGTGTVVKDGSILEYPLAVVMQGSSGIVKLYDLRMNNNTSIYNANGNLSFGELAASSSSYNMNVENNLLITLKGDSYEFTLNNSLIFTLQKTTYNLGILDIWAYSANSGTFIVSEITTIN